MSIYVVSHKELSQKIELPDGYRPIFVGRRAEELGHKYDALTDATRDSIAYLNPRFCELTAIYWIWKNVTDSLKGICHYRRYFTSNGKMLSALDAEKLLIECEYILPEKYWLMQSVKKHFDSHHVGDDLVAVKKILHNKYPDYSPEFEQCLSEHYVYPYNMLIASADSYNKYCEWLFSILFDLNNIIDFRDRDEYQQRAIGFISERLTAVYMRHNKCAVHECQVLTTERDLKRSASMLTAKMIFGRDTDK